jgi:hypothetical protein
MDFNLLQCNPKTLRETHTTCLPQEMLLRLRDAWNAQNPTDPIPSTPRTKEFLWAELRRRMRKAYDCTTEYCAVRRLGDSALQSSARTYFRPERPASWAKNPAKWHDTFTIAHVLEQYEQAFPHFEFIGPVPIDFDARLPGWGKCVVDELCTLDLAAIKRRGDDFIGIVFNLDPHDKPGSHWVCAFINLLEGAAYYYDSYGMPPCPEIKRFLRRCREQGCSKIYWNDIRHQRRDTECGTYCMYVIISMLMGRSFTDVCKHRVDDATMNALRDVVYATEKPRDLAVAIAKKMFGK